MPNRNSNPITLRVDFTGHSILNDNFIPFRDFLVPNLDQLGVTTAPNNTIFVPGTRFESNPQSYALSALHSTNKSGEILVESLTWSAVGGASFEVSFSRPLNTHITEFTFTQNSFLSGWSRDFIFKTFASADGTVFVGGARGDSFQGAQSDDEFRGDGGNDTAKGANGDDFLQGVAGNDNLSGGDDQDFLLGEAGNDVLRGNAGNDVLVFDTGRDVGVGGAGKDLFIFVTGAAADVPSAKAHRTVVKDFDGSEDMFIFQMETVPTLPQTLGVVTLRDMPQNTPDLMSWKSKRGDLILNVDGYLVVLKDTKPGDVFMSRMGFTNDQFVADRLITGPVGQVAQSLLGTMSIAGEGDFRLTAGLFEERIDIFETDVLSLVS